MVSWFEKSMPSTFARFGLYSVPHPRSETFEVGTELNVFPGLIGGKGTVAIATFYQGRDMFDDLIIYSDLAYPTSQQLVAGYLAANTGKTQLGDSTVITDGGSLMSILSLGPLNVNVPLNVFSNAGLLRSVTLQIFEFQGKPILISNVYYKLPAYNHTESEILVSSLPISGGFTPLCRLTLLP